MYDSKKNSLVDAFLPRLVKMSQRLHETLNQTPQINSGININMRSLGLFYVMVHLVYHFSLIGGKTELFIGTFVGFIFGLIPIFFIGNISVTRIARTETKVEILNLFISAALIVISVTISFSDFVSAYTKSHAELHALGSDANSRAMLLLNSAVFYFSLAVKDLGRYRSDKIIRVLLSFFLILSIAIPFSRNPALPAIFLFIIFVRPATFVKPFSAVNLVIGTLSICSLVLFDLRRAYGTEAFVSGRAFDSIKIIDEIVSSAELQVVNRIHDALIATNYGNLDGFFSALIIAPIKNLTMTLPYEELPSVQLMEMYPTYGGFSMLILAQIVSPFLTPLISIIEFLLPVSVALVSLKIAPQYSRYILAATLSNMVNLFRIDFAISVKMLAGYYVPVVLHFVLVRVVGRNNNNYQ